LFRRSLAEIRKAIRLLFADVKFGAGECVEVRVPDKKKHLTAAGWFDDVEALAKAVAKLARDGHKDGYRFIHENTYWTINPVNNKIPTQGILPVSASIQNLARYQPQTPDHRH
jgi:hypothetical protein